MSKRTKLKLRNIRMYLAKYVFNGRYIVRNILAATIIMTLVVLISGAVLFIDDAKKDKAEAQMVAEQQIKEQSVSIYAYEISSVDADSISALKADLEVKTQTAVEANETQMVAEATSEFDEKCVAKTDNINVRKEANVESDIVGTMNNGAVADIVSANGEWLQITSGNISGYVKNEYVLTGKEAEKYAEKYYVATGTVNVDGVYVRDNTSKEAEIIDTAYVGTTYDVDKKLTTSEWVCVNLEDGAKGYVYVEFITVTEGYPTAVVAGDEESEKSSEDDDTDTTDSEDESQTEEAAEDESEEETTTEQPPAESEAEEATTEEPAAEEPTTEEPKQENDNQVTIETTNRGAIALSDADINLMASIMTLECGGESYEGQLAVANVILNRLQSGYYGSTISDVVYAPYQFSVTSSPMLDYYIQNGAQASCIQAAREAASGVNNIGSFTCFRPTWNIDTSTLGAYTIIGNHVFY